MFELLLKWFKLLNIFGQTPCMYLKTSTVVIDCGVKLINCQWWDWSLIEVSPVSKFKVRNSKADFT